MPIIPDQTTPSNNLLPTNELTMNSAYLKSAANSDTFSAAVNVINQRILADTTKGYHSKLTTMAIYLL